MNKEKKEEACVCGKQAWNSCYRCKSALCQSCAHQGHDMWDMRGIFCCVCWSITDYGKKFVEFK